MGVTMYGAAGLSIYKFSVLITFGGGALIKSRQAFLTEYTVFVPSSSTRINIIKNKFTSPKNTHLLILELFQICTNFLFLMNTEKVISPDTHNV